MGMFSADQRRLLTVALLVVGGCGDDAPALQREPDPVQVGDAMTPMMDASGDAARGPTADAEGARDAGSDASDSRTMMPNIVPYPACGGLAALPCPSDEFCSHEVGAEALGCGWADSLGTCKPRGSVCTLELASVCGCNGVTYDSICLAHVAGVSVSALGACKTDRGITCDEREVTCKMARPPCPPLQVPSVVDGCWGECVRIDDCVCHQADECPEREQYVCHMSAQRCGPYVN